MKYPLIRVATIVSVLTLIGNVYQCSVVRPQIRARLQEFEQEADRRLRGIDGKLGGIEKRLDDTDRKIREIKVLIDQIDQQTKKNTTVM